MKGIILASGSGKRLYRAIWLDSGWIKAEGEPEKVVEEYLKCLG
jgi:ABC-type polysaccharide/polyol phosphate transport system ATPase subunit